MLKRLSAVGVSCMTALVLMLSAFVTPSSADAASLEEMASAAISCITSHEGSYGSVNPNDCGAVSVGKLQWHADRALSLMRNVCYAAPDYAATVLGQSLYNEILTTGSWNYRVFSSSEASAAATLLSSDYGVAVQDQTALNDVSNYIISGQNMGLTDSGALVLYADIYNFGCGIAARVAKRAASYAGSYGAVTLEQMHQAALNDSYSSDYAFVSRANSVYYYLSNLGWNYTEPVITQPVVTEPAPEITFTEEGAGTYAVTASALNMRSGAGTGYSVVTVIPYGAEVTVTSIGSNNWAAISYGSYTGYCLMDYLTEAVQVTTTVPEETTTTTATTTVTETETETEPTTEEVTTTEETTTTVEETTTEETTTTTVEETTTETVETTTVTEATTETAATETETDEVTTTTVVTTIVRDDATIDYNNATHYGDVNCDGVVNVTDALLVQKYLVHKVNLNAQQLANADGKRDGKITTADVLSILNLCVGNYSNLPIL